jgi:hypothetical protein
LTLLRHCFLIKPSYLFRTILPASHFPSLNGSTQSVIEFSVQ